MNGDKIAGICKMLCLC